MSQSITNLKPGFVQPQGGEIAEREPPLSNAGVLSARQNLFGSLSDRST